VRTALLAAVTMAWVLQAPLTSTPAAAQWLATTSKQSSEVQPFQAVPAAIEKLQEDALAAFLGAGTVPGVDGHGVHQKRPQRVPAPMAQGV